MRDISTNEAAPTTTPGAIAVRGPHRSVTLPTITPTSPETAISRDIPTDTAARDHPNSSAKGFRNSPKHNWVPNDPTSSRNETATMTQPYDGRLFFMPGPW